MTTNNVISDQHSAVIQNQVTGQIDFLRFNGSTLQASVLRDYGIAGWNVLANGDFGSPAGTADGAGPVPGSGVGAAAGPGLEPGGR